MMTLDRPFGVRLQSSVPWHGAPGDQISCGLLNLCWYATLYQHHRHKDHPGVGGRETVALPPVNGVPHGRADT
jgi:hypothetical protein